MYSSMQKLMNIYMLHVKDLDYLSAHPHKSYQDRCTN